MKKRRTAHKHSTDSKQTLSSKANTSLTVNPSKWIRISGVFSIPSYVKSALDTLFKAGHQGFIVGGSVRDYLLSRPTKDHDIATSADPDELIKLFPISITVGKAFGVIKIPVAGHPYPLEIATFRRDLGYSDHRHPKKIEFADAYEDAQRRDFTINALFYDPKTQRILDQVQGMDDLKARIVRAIGNPAERFEEDALRLLRAVRFSALLDFWIEPLTLKALSDKARLIEKISAERVRDELTQMWTGPRPSQALQKLFECGLLKYVLPEVHAIAERPAHFQRLLNMLDVMARQFPVREVELAWAIVLLEIGKSGKRGERPPEMESAEKAEKVCKRLKMSQAETERIVHLIQGHTRIAECFHMRQATLQRLVREQRFDLTLAVHRIETIVADGNLAHHEFCSALLADLPKAASSIPKVLTGEDLIQFGMTPGPRFSEILRTIEDLTLEGKLTNKEQALEYVLKHFVV